MLIIIVDSSILAIMITVMRRTILRFIRLSPRHEYFTEKTADCPMLQCV